MATQEVLQALRGDNGATAEQRVAAVHAALALVSVDVGDQVLSVISRLTARAVVELAPVVSGGDSLSTVPSDAWCSMATGVVEVLASRIMKEEKVSWITRAAACKSLSSLTEVFATGELTALRHHIIAPLFQHLLDCAGKEATLPAAPQPTFPRDAQEKKIIQDGILSIAQRFANECAEPIVALLERNPLVLFESPYSEIVRSWASLDSFDAASAGRMEECLSKVLLSTPRFDDVWALTTEFVKRHDIVEGCNKASTSPMVACALSILEKASETDEALVDSVLMRLCAAGVVMPILFEASGEDTMRLLRYCRAMWTHRAKTQQGELRAARIYSTFVSWAARAHAGDAATLSQIMEADVLPCYNDVLPPNSTFELGSMGAWEAVLVASVALKEAAAMQGAKVIPVPQPPAPQSTPTPCATDGSAAATSGDVLPATAEQPAITKKEDEPPATAAVPAQPPAPAPAAAEPPVVLKGLSEIITTCKNNLGMMTAALTRCQTGKPLSRSANDNSARELAIRGRVVMASVIFRARQLLGSSGEANEGPLKSDVRSPSWVPEGAKAQPQSGAKRARSPNNAASGNQRRQRHRR